MGPISTREAPSPPCPTRHPEWGPAAAAEPVVTELDSLTEDAGQILCHRETHSVIDRMHTIGVRTEISLQDQIVAQRLKRIEDIVFLAGWTTAMAIKARQISKWDLRARAEELVKFGTMKVSPRAKRGMDWPDVAAAVCVALAKGPAWSCAKCALRHAPLSPHTAAQYTTAQSHKPPTHPPTRTQTHTRTVSCCFVVGSEGREPWCVRGTCTH